MSTNAEQAIRQQIGRVQRLKVTDDITGQTAQIFDQHHLQCDGYRPELGDEQGLHALICQQELRQNLRFEAAVGVRDVFPGQRQHARILLERTVEHPRKMAIQSWRQVVANDADALFDKVEIVHQPIRRRRHHLLVGRRTANRDVSSTQNRLVIEQPCAQPTVLGRDDLGALCARQGLCMLLQALDAEQFAMDWRLRGLAGE